MYSSFTGEYIVYWYTVFTSPLIILRISLISAAQYPLVVYGTAAPGQKCEAGITSEWFLFKATAWSNLLPLPSHSTTLLRTFRTLLRAWQTQILRQKCTMYHTAISFTHAIYYIAPKKSKREGKKRKKGDILQQHKQNKQKHTTTSTRVVLTTTVTDHFVETITMILAYTHWIFVFIYIWGFYF